jgi:hypothetical protein
MVAQAVCRLGPSRGSRTTEFRRAAMAVFHTSRTVKVLTTSPRLKSNRHAPPIACHPTRGHSQRILGRRRRRSHTSSNGPMVMEAALAGSRTSRTLSITRALCLSRCMWTAPSTATPLASMTLDVEQRPTIASPPWAGESPVGRLTGRVSTRGALMWATMGTITSRHVSSLGTRFPATSRLMQAHIRLLQLARPLLQLPSRHCLRQPLTSLVRAPLRQMAAYRPTATRPLTQVA